MIITGNGWRAGWQMPRDDEATAAVTPYYLGKKAPQRLPLTAAEQHLQQVVSREAEKTVTDTCQTLERITA